MASNCIANPKWIAETYLSSPASVACQAAVDSVYGVVAAVVTVANLTSAIVGVLSVLDNDELTRLSWHCGGRAFDLKPVAGDEGAAIKDKIRSLLGQRVANGGNGKFLDHESNLSRWHVQVC